MVKITSILGNGQWLDGGSMFGNAPRAVWEKWTQVDELGRIPLACRCLLIETDKYKILCETGIGAFFESKMAHRFGVQSPEKHMLLENLKSVGVEPDDIDFVILSHLHFDHAGGLLPSYDDISQGQDELLFPKAKYVVGDEAWKRAQSPHFRDRASFVPLLNKKLSETDRLYIVKDLQPPKELENLIEFFESNGHTPGQLHTIVKGQSQHVIFAGDLIPGTPWVHLPITMGYDRFPEKLIEEKQKLYNDFSEKQWQIFFTHDSQYAMGKIEKNEKGKFQATELKENLMALEI